MSAHNKMKKVLEFIKESKKRSILIVFLDFLIFVLLPFIFYFWLYLFSKAITKMPFSLPPLESAALDSTLGTLVKILLSLIGSIIFVIFMPVLVFSIIKVIIWALTLKKKITFKLLLKSILLYFVLSIIFMIIEIIVSIPLINDINSYMTTKAINPNLSVSLLLLAVFLLQIYFLTLASYFLVKENSFRKAFKDTFKFGVLKFHKLMPSLAISFISIAAIIRIFVANGIMRTLPGTIIVILAILFASFYTRIYISVADK
jgi:hypothetical protein